MDFPSTDYESRISRGRPGNQEGKLSIAKYALTIPRLFRLAWFLGGGQNFDEKEGVVKMNACRKLLVTLVVLLSMLFPFVAQSVGSKMDTKARVVSVEEGKMITIEPGARISSDQVFDVFYEQKKVGMILSPQDVGDGSYLGLFQPLKDFSLRSGMEIVLRPKQPSQEDSSHAVAGRQDRGIILDVKSVRGTALVLSGGKDKGVLPGDHFGLYSTSSGTKLGDAIVNSVQEKESVAGIVQDYTEVFNDDNHALPNQALLLDSQIAALERNRAADSYNYSLPVRTRAAHLGRSGPVTNDLRDTDERIQIQGTLYFLQPNGAALKLADFPVTLSSRYAGLAYDDQVYTDADGRFIFSSIGYRSGAEYTLVAQDNVYEVTGSECATAGIAVGWYYTTFAAFSACRPTYVSRRFSWQVQVPVHGPGVYQQDLSPSNSSY